MPENRGEGQRIAGWRGSIAMSRGLGKSGGGFKMAPWAVILTHCIVHRTPFTALNYLFPRIDCPFEKLQSGGGQILVRQGFSAAYLRALTFPVTRPEAVPSQSQSSTSA